MTATKRNETSAVESLKAMILEGREDGTYLKGEEHLAIADYAESFGIDADTDPVCRTVAAWVAAGN